MRPQAGVNTLQLGCGQNADAPELSGQSVAAQYVAAPALQNSHPLFRRSIRIGIVSLRRRAVDGVLQTVLLEVLVHKLAAPVTVNPKDDGVWDAAVLIVYLCNDGLDGAPAPQTLH